MKIVFLPRWFFGAVLVALVPAILVVSCKPATDTGKNTIETSVGFFDGAIRTVPHDGHLFVVLPTRCIIHHPGCPCLKTEQ